MITFREIKKAILAGIMITIGGAVYMSCRTMGLTWLGAVLFSTGLFTICAYGFNLYTGKVGYIAYSLKDMEYIGFVCVVMVVNLLTTFIFGMIMSYVSQKIAAESFNVYVPKLSSPAPRTLLSGFFCGILMFLAVDSWQQGRLVGLFIYVPTFIFSGFDHSIANSFYNGAAFGLHYQHQINPESIKEVLPLLKQPIESFACFSLDNAIVVLTVVIGNAAGAMLVPLMMRKWKEAEDE